MKTLNFVSTFVVTQPTGSGNPTSPTAIMPAAMPYSDCFYIESGCSR